MCSLLAACGGGGSSAGPAPTPTPSPVPSPSTPPAVADCSGGSLVASAVVPAPSIQARSVYTIDANPRSTSVTIDGTAIASALPYTYTPTEQNKPHTVTFNGNYSVPVDQTNNGPHNLLYNASADVAVTVTGAVSQNAAARSPLAIARAAADLANVPRHAPRNLRGLSDVSPNRLYVTYRRGIPAAGAHSLQSIESGVVDYGTDLNENNGVLARAVTLAPGVPLQTAAAKLRASADVLDVQPVHLRHAMSFPTAVTVNDPHFAPDQQWALFKTGANFGWNYTHGATATIAVIDTGIDNYNNDFNGNKITFQECVVRGKTYVGRPAAQDTNGHGTNVAGIAAAATNNLSGFAGLGYDVGIQAYKIFANENPAAGTPDATADTADEARAIYDAVRNQADVINLSLGTAQGPGAYDAAEHDAIAYALSQKVVVVAAAGNEGDPASGGARTIDYPAAYDGVISVGSSALNDTAAPGNPNLATEFVPIYSNAGPGLGLVAPGGGDAARPVDNVPSTTDQDYLHWIYNNSTTTAAKTANQCSSITDCRALFVGTSQATPHVAAAAALIVAKKGHRLLSAGNIAAILESTADDIKDPKQGHGRLNVYRALAIASGDANPPAHPTGFAQFIAFAYPASSSGRNIPQILDVNYPFGVPVNPDGSFRIADVPAGTGSYRIAVWYDANGDGIIDAGDQIAVGPNACNTANPSCNPGPLTVTTVAAGYTLP